jgi:uncharacterized membrane protein YhaH (DUF805 family)
MSELFRLLLLPFGRASRLAFLAGGVGVLALGSALSGATLVLAMNAQSDAIGYLFYALILLSFWCGFCLFANRLHDIGRSAFWLAAPAALPFAIFLPLVGVSGEGPAWALGLAIFFTPVVAVVAGVALLFIKSAPGANDFGDEPRFMPS